ncbi:MAG TPA: polysaccharide biosynthesis C-terminal domain-containing protein, partial [Candidatus Thermoplasmatota archaeon]|nr:polysaccharide biosynthesis C-terminal domain-containing protein [Candidatus Thermoplasmatota archaeon]
GPEYEVAVPVLRILALAQVMILVLGPGQMVLGMTGAERLAGLLVFAAIVIGLPLSFAFYRLDGIEGMAWGRVVSLAVVGVAGGWLGRRRLGQRIDPWVMPEPDGRPRR